MFASQYGRWADLYKTSLKSDTHGMRERIAIARSAIKDRLQELEGFSDHKAERYDIEAAINNLRVLERLS